MEAGSDDEDDGPKDDVADQLAIDKTRSKLQAQHAERYKGIQQLDRELRNQLLKKDIETLARQVDHVNSTGRQAYRDHVRNLVVQDFRNASYFFLPGDTSSRFMLATVSRLASFACVSRVSL